MHSIRLPILALIICAAAFYGYWQWQGRAVHSGPDGADAPVKPELVMPRIGEMPLGAGKRAFFKSYDLEKRLRWQFRAEEYTPPKNNIAYVALPEAVIYLDHGRELHLLGRTGLVHVDEDTTPKGSAALGGPSQPPTRGQLFDVTLTLQSPGIPEPELTLTLNNAAFDLETLRIYTDAYDDPATKQHIPGDQVPVTIRGIDYDFDGKGLLIQWNDVDRRLQLLEIKHGGRAVIKHAPILSRPVNAEADQPPVNAPATAPASPDKVPVAPTQTGLRIEPTVMMLDPRSSPLEDIYRATFQDQIHIEQSGKTLVVADRLVSDFANASRQPAARPANTVGPASDAPLSAIPANTSPKTAVVPATMPVKDPVIVTWTGPLRIVPLKETPMAQVAPGQTVVQLIGSPLVITPGEGEIRAATLLAQSQNKHVLLSNSNQFPKVILKDARGAVIEGDSMEYSADASEAIVSGVCKATIPFNNGIETLSAKWNRAGQFVFVHKGQNRAIEQAHLAGAVVIEHPQLSLSAGQLDLQFEPASGNAQLPLKSAHAEGDVKCRVVDSAKVEQTIETLKLDVLAGTGTDGKLFARSISADGAVICASVDQELSCEHFELALTTPSTTQPTSQVQNLLARQKVRVKLKNGTVATGDQLHIIGHAPDVMVELIGKPGASITDASGNSLTGSIVRLFNDKQQARIPGAGAMRLLRPAKPGEKPTTVDIVWTDGAVFDGKANAVDIEGNVTARSTADNGAAQVGSARRLHVDLLDELTKSDANNVKRAESALLGNKQVGRISLIEDAKLQFVDADPKGILRRRIDVWAGRVDAEVATRKFSVPGPGRMLIVDQLTDQAGGQTAFDWKEGLSYDETTRHAVMAGEVVMVHQPQGKPADVVRMECAKVTADTDEPKPGQTQITLNHLRAEGTVRFFAKAAQFEAPEVTYDPQTQILIARGTDRRPAQMLDDKGLTTGTFEELWFNPRKQTVDKLVGLRTTLRR